MSTHSPAILIIRTVGYTNIFDLVRTCSDIRDYTVYNIFIGIISCFQLLYGVIKYLDYEIDIAQQHHMCIYVVYNLYSVNKFQNWSKTYFQRLNGVIDRPGGSGRAG